MKLIERIDEEEENKINMMPLIDLVFLLLVFFILTMTFIPDEKWLTSLLDKGGPSETTLLEDTTINISFYPSNAPQTDSTKELQQWFENLENLNFVTCKINGSILDLNMHEDHEQQLGKLHAFILAELAKYEDPLATREDQDPVKVHCFSALPWRYAIVGFDALRAHEQEITGNDKLDKLKRSFAFAPNELRDSSYDQLGKEIHRLRVLK